MPPGITVGTDNVLLSIYLAPGLWQRLEVHYSSQQSCEDTKVAGVRKTGNRTPAPACLSPNPCPKPHQTQTCSCPRNAGLLTLMPVPCSCHWERAVTAKNPRDDPHLPSLATCHSLSRPSVSSSLPAPPGSYLAPGPGTLSLLLRVSDL